MSSFSRSSTERNVKLMIDTNSSDHFQINRKPRSRKRKRKKKGYSSYSKKSGFPRSALSLAKKVTQKFKRANNNKSKDEWSHVFFSLNVQQKNSSKRRRSSSFAQTNQLLTPKIESPKSQTRELPENESETLKEIKEVENINQKQKDIVNEAGALEADNLLDQMIKMEKDRRRKEKEQKKLEKMKRKKKERDARERTLAALEARFIWAEKSKDSVNELQSSKVTTMSHLNDFQIYRNGAVFSILVSMLFNSQWIYNSIFIPYLMEIGIFPNSTNHWQQLLISMGMISKIELYDRIVHALQYSVVAQISFGSVIAIACIVFILLIMRKR